MRKTPLAHDMSGDDDTGLLDLDQPSMANASATSGNKQEQGTHSTEQTECYVVLNCKQLELDSCRLTKCEAEATGKPSDPHEQKSRVWLWPHRRQ